MDIEESSFGCGLSLLCLQCVDVKRNFLKTVIKNLNHVVTWLPVWPGRYVVHGYFQLTDEQGLFSWLQYGKWLVYDLFLKEWQQLEINNLSEVSGSGM